jgi:signal peptidase I
VPSVAEETPYEHIRTALSNTTRSKAHWYRNKAMHHKSNDNKTPAGPVAPSVFLYTGPSMNPTLKTGDLLHVAQYEGTAIRRGDVIVFKPAGKTNAVTHRVVAIDGERVQTRGDNNDGTDPWLITRDHVLGRVISATRRGRPRWVHGGVLGRMHGRIVGLRRPICQKLFRLLQPTYRRLSALGIFRWAARSMDIRIVSFARPGMPQELHLQMAGRVIGRLLPGEERWRIKPPFRLLVNEDSLPGNGIKSCANQSAASDSLPVSE